MKIVLTEKRRSLVDDIVKEFNLEPRIFISERAETSSRERTVEWSFFISGEYTNTLIDRLKRSGVGTSYGQISMVPVDFLISSDEVETIGEKSMGVNLEEIIFSLKDSYFGLTYVILAVLSGILAGYGIASKSPVILIGSMIVAPLLGPIALTSVGLLTPGRGFLRSGISTEIAGLLITAFTGFIVGFSIMIVNYFLEGQVLGNDSTNLVLDACSNHEILLRTRLDYGTVVLAIFSGLAAGVIISKGMSVNIVGVAIAASICPPATNIGITASTFVVSQINSDLIGATTVSNFFQPFILATAFLILNVFLINLSLTVVLWVLGIKSGVSQRKRSKVIKFNLIWILLVVTITVLLFILFNPFTSSFTTVNYCQSP